MPRRPYRRNPEFAEAEAELREAIAKDAVTRSGARLTESAREFLERCPSTAQAVAALGRAFLDMAGGEDASEEDLEFAERLLRAAYALVPAEARMM